MSFDTIAAEYMCALKKAGMALLLWERLVSEGRIIAPFGITR